MTDAHCAPLKHSLRARVRGPILQDKMAALPPDPAGTALHFTILLLDRIVIARSGGHSGQPTAVAIPGPVWRLVRTTIEDLVELSGNLDCHVDRPYYTGPGTITVQFTRKPKQ